MLPPTLAAAGGSSAGPSELLSLGAGLRLRALRERATEAPAAQARPVSPILVAASCWAPPVAAGPGLASAALALAGSAVAVAAAESLASGFTGREF